MATQLQLVNKVLRRLRESEVTSVSQTSYSTLIADFLNQILSEVGQEHNWSADEKLVILQTTSATFGSAGLYDGASYVMGSTGLNSDEAHPQVDLDGVPIVTGYFFGDSPQRIKYHVNASNLKAYKANTDNITYKTDGRPDYFSLKQDANGWAITFSPGIDASTTSFTSVVYFYDPQTLLEVDGDDDSTSLRYNERVLLLGTLFLALNERGEELGEPGGVAEQNYLKALADAKYNDQYPLYLTNKFEAVAD